MYNTFLCWKIFNYYRDVMKELWCIQSSNEYLLLGYNGPKHLLATLSLASKTV